MRRPILYWVMLFMLGEVFAKYCSVGWIGIFGILSTVIVWKCKQPYVEENRRLLMIGMLFLVLGGIVFCYEQRQWNVCSVEDGTALTFCGQITETEQKEDTFQYTIAVTELNDHTIRVNILLEYEEPLTVGTRIKGNGVVKNFSKSSNPGGFDERSYQYGKGNVFRIQKAEIDCYKKKYLSIKAYLYQLRSYIGNVYAQLFPEAEASLACAMVLGERSHLDADTKLLYQRNGIAHLIAISGLHIAMLGGTIYHLFRKLFGSYCIAAGAGTVFIVLYGTMAGLSGATLRAVVMLIVSIGADVVGRKYDGITAVSVALFLMLLHNPAQMNQAGFLMSFGAVIGIAVIQPIWKEWLPVHSAVLDGFFVSISVQLVLIPILLYFFYEIPVYSIFLNLVVVPLMSILLFLLILSAVFGGMLPQLGMLSAKGAMCIFDLYRVLCEWSECLPFHTVCTGRPSVQWIILYYMILAVIIWAGYQKKRKMQMFGWLLLGSLFGFFFLPGNLIVCMLDVGQGDGIYVRTPEHKHILIDGGSSSVSKVGTYVLKNGIKYYGGATLDYVFVSHSDSDHYSGIRELLEEPTIQIRHFVMPAIENPDEAYLELVDAAKEKGCVVSYIHRGDHVQIGSVSLECLHPEQQTYHDKNQGSMVLYMQYRKFNMLFTGDMDAAIEKDVVSQLPEQIAILKVAHHGSATASSEEFLNTVSFQTALVSVGAKNRYGHPAQEVLERLKRNCTYMYLTKDHGSITIDSDGLRYSIETMK